MREIEFRKKITHAGMELHIDVKRFYAEIKTKDKKFRIYIEDGYVEFDVLGLDIAFQFSQENKELIYGKIMIDNKSIYHYDAEEEDESN